MEKDDDPLLVPEEPPEEEESSSTYGAESSSQTRKLIEDVPSKSRGFSSIVTAIRVAKWMAKAYGYTSKQKSLFISQDKVNQKQKIDCHLYLIYYTFTQIIYHS